MPFTLVLAQTFDPMMPEPLGVAIDTQDQLYVAGAAGVKVFSPALKLARQIKASGPACAVAVAPDGTTFVAQRQRIEQFSPDGEPLKAWGAKGDGPGQFQFITGLAASERWLFVADAGARKVHCFAPDGDFASELDGFQIPSAYFDCVVDGEGRLLVGHTGRHRVERYDANLELASHWGQFGAGREDFCGCCNPTNFALLPGGRVATTEKGVPRLKVYGPEGKPLLACLGKEHFPGNAAGMDVATDSRGRIILLEPVSAKIRIYELKPTGKN